jgi:hypothetical protein
MRPRHRFKLLITSVRGSIHPAVWIIGGLLTVFALILTFNEPLPYQAAPPVETTSVPTRTVTIVASATPQLSTASLTPTQQFTPTHTPLPPEYLANTEQSIGIIAGTVLLVIVVIGGTLGGALTRKREKQ